MSELNKKIRYSVYVNIENKPFLSDPEGETILNDLILKEGYSDVLSIRTSKSLKIDIMANSVDDAKNKVKKMCDDLRLYNPIVSNCDVVMKRKDEPKSSTRNKI